MKRGLIIVFLIVIFINSYLVYSYECGEIIRTNTVLDTNLFNCAGDGLVIKASNIVLDCNGHIISGSQVGTGINITNRNNVVIKNCEIHNFERGIHIYSGEDNLIQNNQIFDSANYGIYLQVNSHSNKITNNFLSGNYYNNIRVVASNDNEVKTNTLEGSQKSIYIKSNSEGTIIQDNNIYESTINAIALEEQSVKSRVFENTITTSQGDSIYLIDTNTNWIYQNDISNSWEHGIYLKDSTYNTIELNTVTDSTWSGVKLKDSKNNIINGNTLFSNGNYGVYLETSNYNRVDYNHLESNEMSGLYLDNTNLSFSISNNLAILNGNSGIYLKNSDFNKIRFNKLCKQIIRCTL